MQLMLKRLRSEETGMTLTEVLVALSILMVVSIATFGLVDVVMRRSGDVAARVDTTQRSRTAMDQITRELRSQVCAWRSDVTASAARSIDAASRNSLTVYTDLGNESGAISPPDLRTISYDGTNLVETVTKGKWVLDTGRVTYGYASPDITTRRILTDVAAESFVDPATKLKPVIFRYFKYDAANPPQPTIEIAKDLDRALTPAELESVAKINLVYRVNARNGKKTSSTLLQDDIFVRTADPNAPTPKPTCLTY